MMKHLMRYCTALTAAALLALVAVAQPIPVQLEVPESVLNPGDYPEIRGRFGRSARDTGVALNRSTDGLWTGEISPEQQAGHFEYQYVIVRADGTIEPEGYDGRRYEIPAGGRRAAINDYLRGFGPTIDRDIQIEIRLDLSDLHGPAYVIEAVGIAGSWGDLSWNFPGEILLMQNPSRLARGVGQSAQRAASAERPDSKVYITRESEAVWYGTVNFPAGTPLDIPIKFAWKVDDIWDWEPLPHYHIHLVVLNPDANVYFAAYRFNRETMRIEPDEALGLELDAYLKATEYYKGSRNYHYHLALDLLHKEDLQGSEAAYAAYQNYLPEEAGSSSDDYFTQKMQFLSRIGQHERALKEIESKYAQEAQSPRGAYYLYMRGWVLLHAERLEESRQAMRQSMELADDADQYHSQGQYARYGLAMGYMRDPDPEEQRNARWYLLGLVNTHTNQHIRRLGWEQVAHIAENDEDTSLYEQAMDALQHTGSPRQRNRSRIRWAQYLMDHAPADSARTVLERLETDIRDADLADEVQLLKAEQLLRQSEPEAAQELLEQIQSRQVSESIEMRARHQQQEVERSIQAIQAERIPERSDAR